jgi:hypothetical protein
MATEWIANPSRYTGMLFRRCGGSGLMRPPISLERWQNFGVRFMIASGQTVPLDGVRPRDCSGGWALFRRRLTCWSARQAQGPLLDYCLIQAIALGRPRSEPRFGVHRVEFSLGMIPAWAKRGSTGATARIIAPQD